MISALLTIANHPNDLLDSVLCTPDEDIMQVGIVTARFFVDGQWREITTDTRTPYSPTGHGPLFSHCLNPAECWLQVLQKAWAKLRGSYEGTHCGHSALMGFADESAAGAPLVERAGGLARALCAVTGGIVEEVQLSGNARLQAQLQADVVWSRMQTHFLQKGSPIALRIDWASAATASFVSPSAVAAAADGAGGTLTHRGLLRGLAYPVLYMKDMGRGIRLVKLRNPYGGARSLGGSASEWGGDWSDSSDLWSDRPEVEAALIDDPDPRCDFERAQEGVFWMEWKDVCSVFSQLFVVRMLSQEHTAVQAEGQWEGESAAGPPSTTATGSKVLDAADSASLGEQEGSADASAPITMRQEVSPVTGLPLRLAGRQEVTGAFTVPDGDTSFFRNPQFRLTIPKVALSAKGALNVTKAEAMAQSLGTSVDAVLDARAAGKSAGLLMADAAKLPSAGSAAMEEAPMHLGPLAPTQAEHAAAAAGVSYGSVLAKGGLLGSDGQPLHKVGRVKKGAAKVILSLSQRLAPVGAWGGGGAQEDAAAPAVPLRFLLLRRRRGERGRVWDLKAGDVVADSAASKFAPVQWTDAVGREAVHAAVWLDPAYSYVVVPFTAARTEATFLLRVAALRSDISMTFVPQPAAAVATGRWGNDAESAGGALRLPTKTRIPSSTLATAQAPPSQGNVTLQRYCRANPRWGLNPQFMVALLNPPSHAATASRTAASRRGGAATGAGAGATGSSLAASTVSAAQAHITEADLASVGVSGRALPTQRSVTIKFVLRRTDRGAGRDGKEVDGVVLRNTLGMSVCRAQLSTEGAAALAAMDDEAAARSRSRGASRGSRGGSRGRSRGGARGSIPPSTWEKRSQVQVGEWCQLSSHGSEAVASCLVRVPEAWLDGSRGRALCVTPSLLWPGKEGDFTLMAYTDASRPVGVSELVSDHVSILPGQWTKGKTAGGNHLQAEWPRNPAFEIAPQGGASGTVRVKVTLSRPASAWAAALREDPVACMMGFYVLTCAEDKAARYNDGRRGLIHETKFAPGDSVTSECDIPFGSPALRGRRVLLLPCTFEAGHAGPFTLSVTGSVPVSVQPFVAPPTDDA